MALEAVAKKWWRFSNCGAAAPASLRKASCSSAVVFRVSSPLQRRRCERARRCSSS
jgi:hypothetical protein